MHPDADRVHLVKDRRQRRVPPAIKQRGDIIERSRLANLLHRKHIRGQLVAHRLQRSELVVVDLLGPRAESAPGTRQVLGIPDPYRHDRAHHDPKPSIAVGASLPATRAPRMRMRDRHSFIPSITAKARSPMRRAGPVRTRWLVSAAARSSKTNGRREDGFQCVV
jgi:hypothetical protein